VKGGATEAVLTKRGNAVLAPEAISTERKIGMGAGVWNARLLLRELWQRDYPGGFTISDGVVARRNSFSW
jgi:hypothetical protein